MTLERAFNELASQWRRLAEELEQGLLWSITEAKPDGEHSLTTHYIDAATDAIAIARDGLAACRAAIEYPPGLQAAGQTLLRCQEQYNALVRLFHSEMASCARVRRLRRFGREKGGAWCDWAKQVRTALNRCRRPLDDLSRALLSCWQEIVDRVGIGLVSVHAMNIGQQFGVPRDEGTVESVT
jgi:hypothetical protein